MNDIVARLRAAGSQRDREGMARYAIPSERAFGVRMAVMQRLAKEVGPSHALALALWKTGWYEARTTAAFVDDPARVTRAQMDRWASDFDSWAICDTVCFHLFDKTPHAFAKVKEWAGREEEFVKRAGFALLASLALHDKAANDQTFLRCLPLVEREAGDDCNFVKKGVSWALRLIGRRNAALNAASIALSRRLVEAPEPAARWIGRDALKELTGAVVARRLAKATGPRASS